MSLLDAIMKPQEKTISIACEGSMFVRLEELNELQSYKNLTDEAYQKAKTSILELGFSFPIFVWENEGKMWIIDAHQRKRVLTRLRDVEGYVIPPLPAVRIHAKDKVEAKKKILAQESQYGDITEEGLYEFMNEEGFELDETELETFVDIDEFNWEQEATEVTEDEAPEVSSEPAKSELGKVYQLGRHRLMCGDATKIEDVEKLMNGQKADIAFTSPPYNVGENAKLSFHDKDNDNKYKDGYKDDNPEYLKLLLDTTANQLSYSDYAFINLQMLANNKRDVIEWLYALKEKYADVVIWNKEHSQPAMADNVMNSDFEFVFVFSNGESNRSLGTGQFRGTVSNVYTAPPQRENEFADSHAATFPVHFPTHFIKNFVQDGGSVLDVFGGTGTTLIACEQTNRTCYMMELDPKYCDVIRKRYAKFIGKENEWESLTPSVDYSE